MPAAPLPPNEIERLEALWQARLLDTPPEPFFEDIVDQVRQYLGPPIALVSLVDESRQWFKACCGLTVSETDRESAFCAHAILGDTPLIVADALADPRFASNPLVLGAPYIRAYAGAPIELASGMRLGTVCAIDIKARDWTPAEIAFLARSARLTARYIEARLAMLQLADARLSAETAAADALRSRDALAESEQQFRGIAESARDIIVRYEPDTTMTYVSPACMAVLGYAPEELVGRRMREIIHPDELGTGAKLLAAVASAGPDGPPVRMRMRALQKDGAWRWMEGAPRVVTDATTGAPLMFYDVIRDVAAQQELEEALVAARECAEAAGRAKSDFLANMSHELRTPLNSVSGFSRLLADSKDLTERDRRFASLIEASSRATLTIVNDVLDFAAVEKGAIVLREAPFSVRDLIFGVRDMMAPFADAKGLALSAGCDQSIADSHFGDADRLRQVLINLTSNAVKFTDAGAVSLSASAADNSQGKQTLCIAIQDSGMGVPAHRCEEIFERFVRLDDDQRGAGGSGLGLSIARNLVQAMGGAISLESEVGRGSTFSVTLTLPVAAVAVAVAAAAAAAPKRILVVDDVDLNRELAQTMLELAGHTVETAHDGAGAVALSQHTKFDIILMDVQMPGMDGLAATRAIRGGGGASAQSPIVALTAGALPEQVASYLLAGMNGYLAKPLLDDDLTRAVAAWTGVVEPDPSLNAAQAGIVEELQSRFAARLVEDRVGLQAALQTNPERPNIRALVHRLAGSAGSLGFVEIGELAGVVDETLARGQAPLPRDVAALVEALDEAIGRSERRPAA